MDSVDVAIYCKMRFYAGCTTKEPVLKRDMEVIRALLRAIRAKNDLKPRMIAIEGFDDDVVGRHLEILFDDGYITGIGAPMSMSDDYKVILVRDLSGPGHDLAAALLTDDGVWAKVKAAIGPDKIATMSLRMVESVATAALTAWATDRLGLS